MGDVQGVLSDGREDISKSSPENFTLQEIASMIQNILHPDLHGEVSRVLRKFKDHIDKLRRTDVEVFQRKIEESPDIESKSRHMSQLIEENVPASLDLLERLLEESEKDPLLYLEWLSHRQNVAISVETFKEAKEIAEWAHEQAKGLYLLGSPGLSEKAVYYAYIKACANLLLVLRHHENTLPDDLIRLGIPKGFQPTMDNVRKTLDVVALDKSDKSSRFLNAFLEEALKAAEIKKDLEGQHLLLILKGDLLLAKGDINTAIDTVFTPLLKEPHLSVKNKGLLLQKFGNACRSAGRWGLAKEYLCQSISIAQEVGDSVSEYDRMADLGNVYRSEGRIADALKYYEPHMAFVYKRGDLRGINVSCFNMSFAYINVRPNPDFKRAMRLLFLYFVDMSSVLTTNEPETWCRETMLKAFGKSSGGASIPDLFEMKGINEFLDLVRDTIESPDDSFDIRPFLNQLHTKFVSKNSDQFRKFSNVFVERKIHNLSGMQSRISENYDEAIESHRQLNKFAQTRGDDETAANMQRELAKDYLCKKDLERAEKQARAAISTLEIIREKLDGEDSSKIANFDINQSETFNLLQVILCQRKKYAEALAVCELGKSRALTDLLRDKLLQTREPSAPKDDWIYTSNFVSRWQDQIRDIQDDFIQSADELRTNFLIYSVLKEFNNKGSDRYFLYIWLVLNGISAKGQDRIHFRRIPLSKKIQSELLVDYGFFSSLTRSFTDQAEGAFSVSKKKEVVHEKPAVEEHYIDIRMPQGPEVEELFHMLGFSSVSATNECAEAASTKQDPRISDESERKPSCGERAESVLMPAMEESIQRKPSSENSKDNCLDYMELKTEGNALFSAGDFSGAVKKYSKGLKLCSANTTERATLLKNRAAAYLKLGEYQKVVDDTTAALEITPSDVKALFRRCQAYEQIEKYNEAFKDATAVNHLDPKNSAIQTFLRELNIKHQEIMPAMEESIQSKPSSENSNDNCLDYMELKNEGNALFSAGDFSGAVKKYSKGLNLCSANTTERATLLKNRAAAYLKLGEYQKVVDDTTAALEITPSDVKALFRRCQAYEQIEKYNEAFKDATAVNHLDPKNSAIQTFLRKLNIKHQEIMPAMEESIQRKPSSENSNDNCLDYMELKNEGNALFSAGDLSGAVKKYSKGLNLCSANTTERATLLKNRAAAYLKLGEYQKVVDDTTAALEITPSDVKALFRRCQAYEQLEKSNEAFKDATAVNHLDPKNSAIQPILRNLNIKHQKIERILEPGSWAVEGFQQLQQLYDICVSPVIDLLPEEEEGGSVPSITVLPHEFLFGVPFCCLQDGAGKDKRHLVERFVISYAPSLLALRLLNKRLHDLRTKQGSSQMKVLAMGHAFMDLPNVRELPGSGEEAKSVKEVFGPEHCRLALRGDATKQLMLQELQNIDILHVATHASPQDVEEKEQIGDYSMRGCILLSSSDDTCYGVVKASEIASVDCNCQLVTLSCCETGLGKVTGDGVVGLYRAFFAAGAASVLVTLWKIRDDITRMFMEHFYNEFKATGNVSGSLRSTMVYCIREKKLPPQQWAAFSHIGAAL